jgi:hypothetical protein
MESWVSFFSYGKVYILGLVAIHFQVFEFLVLQLDLYGLFLVQRANRQQRLCVSTVNLDRDQDQVLGRGKDVVKLLLQGRRFRKRPIIRLQSV